MARPYFCPQETRVTHVIKESVENYSFLLYSFILAQHQRTKEFVSKQRFWRAVNVLDYKFLFIPVAFTILRIWTCLINVFYVYSDVGRSFPRGVTVALIYLSVSDYVVIAENYEHP